MPSFFMILLSRAPVLKYSVTATTHPHALHWTKFIFHLECVIGVSTSSKECFPHLGQDDAAIGNSLPQYTNHD